MTSSFSIFVIILNYKRYGDTSSCLLSLFASDFPKNACVLIVDNSHDKSEQEHLKKMFHGVKLISNRTNLGFSAGNNRGIDYALKHHASHILIINPDTIIPKVFFKPLFSPFLKDSPIGIVAPVLKHRQNNTLMYGLEGSVDWRVGKPSHINRETLPPKQLRPAEFVTFACAAISRTVFETIGLLDEKYFMYLEDVDFCLRARQANFGVYLYPTVVIEHKTSSSFRRPTDKLFYSFPSHLYFVDKWMAFPQKIIAFLYLCLFYPYLYLLWTIHGLKMYHFKWSVAR